MKTKTQSKPLILEITEFPTKKVRILCPVHGKQAVITFGGKTGCIKCLVVPKPRTRETNSKMELLFTATWKNKAKIEVGFYKGRIKGEAYGDRIHLLITPADGKTRGWLMNVQDANDIIYGLSKGISRTIEEMNIRV